MYKGLSNQLNNINTIKTGPAYMNGYGDPRPKWSNPAPSEMMDYYTMPQEGPINKVINRKTQSTRQTIPSLPYPAYTFDYPGR
jgi:hypothetical protein